MSVRVLIFDSCIVYKLKYNVYGQWYACHGGRKGCHPNSIEWSRYKSRCMLQFISAFRFGIFQILENSSILEFGWDDAKLFRLFKDKKGNLLAFKVLIFNLAGALFAKFRITFRPSPNYNLSYRSVTITRPALVTLFIMLEQIYESFVIV